MGRRQPRRYGSGNAKLNITSMMDVLTIVLVFLLKNFESEGNLLTQADNLKLPYSVSKKTVKEIAITVVVDNEQVLVDNTPVFPTDSVRAQDSLLVAPMMDMLKEKREEEKKVAMASGDDEATTGTVIVQLDKNIPYDVMYKVMATCGFSGYGNIAFAVVQKNAE